MKPIGRHVPTGNDVSSILIVYQGAPAALVGATRLSFLREVRHLPPGHPVVRVVAYMAYYAQLVLTRQMPSPYTDDDAERFARVALIDPDDLVQRLGHSDEVLATHFQLPLEQIRRAREELGDPAG
jgi:hypothetical protein